MQQLSGVVAIGVSTCASLSRLNSIVGCSKNTRIGKFPALQCVWKHIANSKLHVYLTVLLVSRRLLRVKVLVLPKYPKLEKSQFLGA